MSNLDLTDVLTQIAFTTLIAYFISPWKIRYQVIACIGILILTELLYRIPYIPNLIEGYTDGVNTGSYLDYILFGQEHNHYVFINWLPTSVHTIAGFIVGRLILRKTKLTVIILPAILLLVLGYTMDMMDITKMIKPIATSSFVMASLGYCLLLLFVLYYWIDIKGHRKGIEFFNIVGMNSIFIYLFIDVVGRRWFNGFVQMVVAPIELNLGVPHPYSIVIGSLIIFALEWYLCLFLYRKKVFIKV